MTNSELHYRPYYYKTKTTYAIEIYHENNFGRLNIGKHTFKWRFRFAADDPSQLYVPLHILHLKEKLHFFACLSSFRLSSEKCAWYCLKYSGASSMVRNRESTCFQRLFKACAFSTGSRLRRPKKASLV